MRESFLSAGEREGGSAGSSGTIAWWDTEHSPTGQRGITVNSYGGTAALVSERHHALVKSRFSTDIESTESNINIRTHTAQGNSGTFLHLRNQLIDARGIWSMEGVLRRALDSVMALVTLSKL